MNRLRLALPLLALAACSSDPAPAPVDAAADVSAPDAPAPQDATSPDVSVPDVSADAVVADSARDVVTPDAPAPDAPAPDAPAPDVSSDAPAPDAPAMDAPAPDVSVDAFVPDVTAVDAVADARVDAPTPDAAVDVPAADASVGACRLAWHAVLPNQARSTPTLTLHGSGTPWVVWFDMNNRVNAVRIEIASTMGAWRSAERTVDLPTHPAFALWEGDLLRVTTRSFLSPQSATFEASGAVRAPAADLVMGNGIERGPWIVRSADTTWVFWRRPASAASTGALLGVALDAAGAARGTPILVAADVLPMALAWDGAAFVSVSRDAGGGLQLTRFDETGATRTTGSLPAVTGSITQVSLAVTAAGLDVVASDFSRIWLASTARDLTVTSPWRAVVTYQYSTEWATIAGVGARRALAWADTRFSNSTGTVRFARLDAAGNAITPALDVYSIFTGSPQGGDVRLAPVGAASWVLAWRSLPTATSVFLEAHVARVECPATP